jgi:hypothetical protein
MFALIVRSAGANFSLQLRSPCLSDMVEGVMGAESSYEHWGLLHRLQRVLELLDNAEAAGGAGGQLSLCVCYDYHVMGFREGGAEASRTQLCLQCNIALGGGGGY